MFKLLTGLVLTFVLLSVPLLAQDPNLPDSLIIAIVSVEMGIPSVMVPVYACTDDSVAEMVLPLEWDSMDDKIHPAGAYYFNTLLLWDEMEDTIIVDERHQVIWGTYDTGGDPNPVLNTNYQLQLVMMIRMVIHPGASEQFVPINPYIDSFWGPAEFILSDGTTSFMPDIVSGGVYYGIVVDVEDQQKLPGEVSLGQNYPNPFNMSTEINFSIRERGYINLEIYNILGEKVKTLVSGTFNNGFYTARWDGTDDSGLETSTGIYFYTLKSENSQLTKKMLLVK